MSDLISKKKLKLLAFQLIAFIVQMSPLFTNYENEYTNKTTQWIIIKVVNK